MPKPRARASIHLYQRPENGAAIWWYDFRAGGRRHRRSTGTDDRGQAESTAFRARETALQEAGRPGRGEGVDLALLGGLDVERGAAKGIGASQRQSLEDSWAHLCRILGAQRDPATVDYDLVEGYIRQRREEGMRGQSIQKEVQCLKRGLRQCKRKRWISELPELPQIRHDPKNKAQAGKLHAPAILMRWLDALDHVERADGARAQAELVLRTGLRAEEVRRLTVDWIEPAPPDLLDVVAMLHVPADKAKNRKERMVGLTAQGLALIEYEAAASPSPTPFAGLHRRAFISAAAAVDYLDQAGKPKVITLRDLRHTHSTLGAWGTGDAAGVQSALGHSDLATTQRYLSATLGRTAAAAVAVGHMLAGPGHRDRPQQIVAIAKFQRERVETIGIEPTTSCLQSEIEAALLHLSGCSSCASQFLELTQICRDSGGVGHSDGHRRAAG